MALLADIPQIGRVQAALEAIASGKREYAVTYCTGRGLAVVRDDGAIPTAELHKTIARHALAALVAAQAKY